MSAAIEKNRKREARKRWTLHRIHNLVLMHFQIEDRGRLPQKERLLTRLWSRLGKVYPRP